MNTYHNVHAACVNAPGAAQQKLGIPAAVVPRILSYCAYGYATVVNASRVNKEWHNIATSLYLTLPMNVSNKIPRYFELEQKRDDPHPTLSTIEKLYSVDKLEQYDRAYYSRLRVLCVLPCGVFIGFLAYSLALMIIYLGVKIPNDVAFSSQYHLTNCTITNITGGYHESPHHSCSCYNITMSYYCTINQTTRFNSMFQSSCDCDQNRFYESLIANKTYSWYVSQGTDDMLFVQSDYWQLITLAIGCLALFTGGVFLCVFPCCLFCSYKGVSLCNRKLKIRKLWKTIIMISDDYPGEHNV
jgi:hypothetical protein